MSPKYDITGGLSFLTSLIDETSKDEDFSEEPVDLETFLYSGDYLKCPKLSEVQFKFVEALSDIYKGCEYDEAVAEWGKGSGKDFCCAVALCVIIYRLLCLRDPAAYYGLNPGSRLWAINVAVNGDQATSVFFSEFMNLLKNSPFFRGQRYSTKGGRVTFAKNITALSGHSEMEGMEGHNVIVAILDEIDAFKTDQEVAGKNRRAKSARMMYDRMRSSAQSRFPGIGKIACISFPRFYGSFIQQRREQGLTEPRTFVSSPEGVPTWIANPLRTREDFDAEFAKDPETAAMLYECKPPQAKDAYIRHKEFIMSAFGAKLEGYVAKYDEESKRPFREVYVDDTDPLWHKYQAPYLKPNPHFSYYVHVDLAATRDKAGFCMSTFDGTKAWITLMWAFQAPQNGEIDFEAIENFIISLSDMGFHIAGVTYDGWQSRGSLQRLTKLGYECKVQSVKKEQYDTLKDMMYSGDVEGYFYPLLIEELLGLELIKGKTVDHKDGGSNDVADAVAGSVWSAVKSKDRAA